MTTYAFCLGVNAYKAPIDALKCAERDARDFAAFLKEGLGFEAEYIEERMTEQIESKIESLEPGLKPGDQFIFYFSGHGKTHGSDQYFLLPGCRYDTLDEGNAVTGGVLSWNALKKITSHKKWQGVHRIFIFDACRTHLIAKKGAGEHPAFAGEYLLRDPAFAKRKANGAEKNTAKSTEKSELPPLSMFNSCDEGKCAVELPGQGNGVGNGVFTLALIEGLKQAAKRGREIILDGDFSAALEQRMQALSQAHGLSDIGQKPIWKGDIARLPLPVMSGPFGPASEPILSAAERDEREWQLVLLEPTLAKLEAYYKNAPPKFAACGNGDGENSCFNYAAQDCARQAEFFCWAGSIWLGDLGGSGKLAR